MRRERRSIVVIASALLVAGCASAPTAGSGGVTSARGSVSVMISPSPTPSTSDPVPPVPLVARRFAWSDSGASFVPEAFTLTVVTGISPRDALRILAPNPEVPVGRTAVVRRRLDRLDASRPPGDYENVTQLVTATRRGRYTLLLEDNDFAATTGSAPARLAAHGVAAVLYTNVESLYTYLYARNNRLIRSFDPFLGENDVGRSLPEERGLPFARDDTFYWTNAMSLELTRRLTGYVTRPRDFEFATYTLAMGTRTG